MPIVRWRAVYSERGTCGSEGREPKPAGRNSVRRGCPYPIICKSRRRISLRTEESVKKVRGFCRRHRQPNIPALVRPFDMLKICKNLYLPLKLSRDLVICIHPADNTGQVVHQNMGAA